MAQFVKNYVQDLAQDIQIRHCGTLIFNTDSDSNVINVSLYNGQEEAPQSGSVACAVICSDGSTVPVTGGTISGNTVSVTLGADGLIPGQVGIGIQVISGDVKTTVFKAVYSVELFETDTVVDPSSRITISVGELVQDIEDAVASIPADYSDLLAAIAPDYADLTFPVKKGTFCWHSGTLYTANQDIATSESWTASHWVSAPLANELSGRVDDLKSAITQFQESGDMHFDPADFQVGGIDTSTGDIVSSHTKRVVMTDISTATYDMVITADITHKMSIAYYTNNVYEDNSGWKANSSIAINKGQQYRVVIADYPTETESTSVKEKVSGISCTSIFSNLLSCVTSENETWG